MKTAGLAFLIALGGYVAGALLGIGLVQLCSTKHDKSVEAPMTGFFVVGPLVALLTFIGALLYLESS
jgi:hypothetical protein